MKSQTKKCETDSQTDEAQRILQEYQDFAYIVSHDLNAPLRHIREFTRLLIGARRDGLNEEEREYVNLLEGSLSRIDKMQQGLLAFSRVNSVNHPFESIQTNDVVDRVLNALEGDILEYNPQITVETLPDVYGDPSQIYAVFYNLVENAIKFHKDGSARKVTISALSKNGMNTFTIRDNGIGVKEDFCNEIFRIFRRLHTDHEYEGSGVGLTVAQKIINRHGGDIKLKSVPDDHTEVIFTLPSQA